MAKIHILLIALVVAAASASAAKRTPADRMTVWGPNIEQPVLLKRVDPPPIKTRARIETVAVFQIAIDETGHVVRAEVLKPVAPGLAEQAEKAVRQWKFRPGRVKSIPVPVIQTVTVTFRIE